MEGKKGFSLWPFNWILYGIAIVVAGWFIGYLWSTLIVVAVAVLTRTGGAAPKGSYCLDRTRKQLARLGYALLFLVIGAGCAVVFFTRFQEDRTGWDARAWLTLAVAGVFGLGALLLCLYETFTSLRDALFPGHSRLARSIRAHLPPADQLLGTAELFELVDRDLRENGRWFDRVAVGKEWILGDEASAISRIRVVAGQNETTHHHHNGRTTTNRTIQLHILDDRQKVQLTELRSAAELQPLLDCIRLRAPDAIFCPYASFAHYSSMKEEDWQALERDYQARRSKRAAQTPRTVPGSDTGFVLTDTQGRRTSIVTREAIEKQLEAIRRQGERFALSPTEPIPFEPVGWLVRMECGVSNAGVTLVAVVKKPDNTFCAYGQPVERTGAANMLRQLAEQRQLPDLAHWQPLQAVAVDPQT